MATSRGVELLAAVALLVSCGPTAPKPEGPTGAAIIVREFDVGSTVVTRYDAPISDLGMQLANRIALILTRMGSHAVAVPTNARDVPGEVLVTGRITNVDGGSRGARVAISLLFGFGFTSYGAGGATFAAQGQLTRHDGKTVAVFREVYTKRSTGWFWVRYGESSERQVRASVRGVGTVIARSIALGRYSRGIGAVEYLGQDEPASSPREPAAAVPERGVQQRLQELERLHREGLLTDREYEEQRSKILEDL